MGTQCCSGEVILLWGESALGREICSGELLWGESALGRICSGDKKLLWGCVNLLGGKILLIET
ncbi:MAG TPA: hypothetical protein P5543_02775 [Planctomycetota bacterium]|nr:hypothetical protein [Planctomycetota bacterium]HRU51099.1 hypothetical protein [Planctomycetota bacterium]